MKLSELIEKLQEIKKDREIKDICYNDFDKLYSVGIEDNVLYINNEIQSQCPDSEIFYYYNFKDKKVLRNEFVPVDGLELMDWKDFVYNIRMK